MAASRLIRSAAACAVMISARLVRLFGPMCRSNRGVAALEFALIAPFLIAMLLSGFEVAHYVNSERKLTYLANSVAQTFAQNTTGTIDWTDLLAAQDSAMITFPEVLSDAKRKGTCWWCDITIAMASVVFTPNPPGCTSNCTYNATAAWTYHGRSCGVQFTPVPDGSPPTPTTLPTDVYGPGSLIVIDVSYNYTPLVASQLFSGFTIRRSVYLQPRYVSLVKYTWGNGIGSECPGY